jgi:hypothetical protein
LPGTAREEAWQEIGRELGKYEGRDGFESPCEIIVGAAIKK